MFFFDDCFKPNVLLQWQNISSEFCRQPMTQPRRFFGGSKSKPVDPLRFQFECICAGDLSVIGFSWIQRGRIYMRSKTAVVGLDLKNQWCVLWSHTAHIECQKGSIQVKVREKKNALLQIGGTFGEKKTFLGIFWVFQKKDINSNWAHE